MVRKVLGLGDARVACLGAHFRHVVLPTALRLVAEDKVDKQKKAHPDSVQDEEHLWRSIQGESEGYLDDSEDGHGSSQPLVERHAQRAEFGDAMDDPTPNELNHEHDEDGNANPMVRVRQRPLRSDGEEGQDKGGQQKQAGKDVQPRMVSNRIARLPRVEPRNHDGEGHQEEKDHGGHDAVRQDDGMVLVHGGEAVAHSCVEILLDIWRSANLTQDKSYTTDV
jgi:hypothetical protein